MVGGGGRVRPRRWAAEVVGVPIVRGGRLPRRMSRRAADAEGGQCGGWPRGGGRGSGPPRWPNRSKAEADGSQGGQGGGLPSWVRHRVADASVGKAEGWRGRQVEERLRRTVVDAANRKKGRSR